MPTIFFLLKGLLLGFSIAAPVGPIGLLCINKTLDKGKLSGFLSGMGAASADMIYGIIAAFSLTSISSILIKQSHIIKIVGGVFLLYLGINILLKKKANTSISTDSKNLYEDYASTFFLTITNPMTIISFTAVFAGLGIAETAKNILSSSFLVLGVFIGSALWWLVLATGVAFISKKSNEKVLKFINIISGIIILIFAGYSLLS